MEILELKNTISEKDTPDGLIVKQSDRGKLWECQGRVTVTI